MTTLTEKFTALEADLAAQNEAVLTELAKLDTINGGIIDVNATLADSNADFSAFASSLSSNLATLAANMVNGLNAIRSAIYETACPCEADLPLIPPPLTPTPPFEDGDPFCQRIQFFIDLYRFGILITEGTYVNSAGSMNSVTPAVIQANALADLDIVTGELWNGMPSSVGVGVASAWNQLISAAGAPAANGLIFDLANDNDQWLGIRSALYTNISASDAFPAVVTAISEMSVSASEKAIVSAGFYSSWLNDIYSEVPIVDASEYDGTVCSEPPPGMCVTIWEDDTFDFFKTCDDGHNYTFRTIPSWADYVEFDITFSDGFNVTVSGAQAGDCEALPAIVSQQGYDGNRVSTISLDSGTIRYFSVGGFFSGLPNGSSVNVIVNYVRACTNGPA